MRAHLPLRAVATAFAVALVHAASAGAGSSSYPPVYHLIARVAQASGSGSGMFTGTLVPHGRQATLRWKLTFSALPSAATWAGVRTRGAGATPATALRLCPPQACRSGVKGVYNGQIGMGTAFLSGLLHGRGYVEVRTASPMGVLRGRVMVAQAVGA
jgi:hypothetical protein